MGVIPKPKRHRLAEELEMILWPSLRSLLLILMICFFMLWACQPTRVKIDPGRPYPVPSSPAEPAPHGRSPDELTAAKPPSSEALPTRPIPSEPSPAKGFEETVSEWKSFQDVQKWMETQFSLDRERFKRYEQTLPIPYSPEETFRRRSGIYIDSALFIKEALNRIHPSHRARVVVIILRPYGSNHYACSFIKDKKTYIMDYGTPYRGITGLHGPFNTLDEYRKFFEKNYPLKKRVEGVRYL